jgi:hypothetical protein
MEWQACIFSACKLISCTKLFNFQQMSPGGSSCVVECLCFLSPIPSVPCVFVLSLLCVVDVCRVNVFSWCSERHASSQHCEWIFFLNLELVEIVISLVNIPISLFVVSTSCRCLC